MLAGGDVIASGRIHDDDALLSRRIDIDVLKSHSGSTNDFQIFCGFDQLCGYPGSAADYPAIVVGADFLELVGLETDPDIDFESASPLKNFQSLRRQRIADENLHG